MRLHRSPLLATAALALSCGNAPPRTGIVVEVTSDLAVPGELSDVLLTATGAAGGVVYERSFALVGAGGAAKPTFPLRVGFELRGDATATFRIEARGLRQGVPVVSRSATVRFLSGHVVLLSLPLLSVCAAVPCPQTATTCQNTGACGSDVVDPSTLPPYRPGVDAGGAPDAGRDATDGPAADGAPDLSFGETGGDAPSADAPIGDATAGGDAGRDAQPDTSIDIAGDVPTMVPTLNDGLVGYWSFDQGVATIPDHSGNGNHINTAGVAVWTAAGPYGGALDLTAPDRQVGVGGTASVNGITTAISIAAFARVAPGAVRTLISRYLGLGYWKLGFSDNGALRFTAGASVVQTAGAVGDGMRFVHVAVTYDGVTARLYVDGSLAASATLGPVSLVGGPPQGGAGGYGPLIGGTFMDITADTIEDYGGMLDELTLYNRALTAMEVDAMARGVFPARR